STSPTAPIPAAAPGANGSGLKSKLKTRPKPEAGATPGTAISPTVPLATGKHLWWLIAGGIAVVVLCVTATVIAYQIGKGSNSKSNEPSAKNPDAPRPDDLTPSSADNILMPLKAVTHVGETQTVEFKVQAWSEPTSTLTSEAVAGQPDSFVVRIAPE